MKKFVAITKTGTEYMYIPRSAHAIPVSKLPIVLNILNRSRFLLKDGEQWHAYESGGGEVYAEHQSFGFRSGRLTRFCSSFRPYTW